MRNIRSALFCGAFFGIFQAAGVATAHADGNSYGTSDVKARVKLQAGPSLLEASPEKTAQAIGYYERSRSLLLAAVREFDKGYAKANPSVVLNALSWREDIINRIQELDRVLAPQARITEGGVKFDGQRELLASEAGKKR